MSKFSSAEIQSAYASMPAAHQSHLKALRQLILDVANTLALPGGIEETLKWGEPSYLPVKPRVGSTVRVGSFNASTVALYFNCQTMLVEQFRSMFGDTLRYSKNRAVLFSTSEPLPDKEVRICVSMALRYHLDKKARSIGPVQSESTPPSITG